MGKNSAKDSNSEKEGKEKPKAVKKAAEICKKETDATPGFLANLRPRRRSIFFLGFTTFCGLLVLLHNGCDIPKNKRQDCGFPDITVTECKWLACFTKGGGSATAKKTIKVSRLEQETLGLEVSKDKVNGWVAITAINAGAVMTHNNALPADSEDRIAVGDRISKVDSVTANTKKADNAHERLAKALAGKGAKKVQLEVQRPRIPASLMWVRDSTGKPNLLEKVLTSPGAKSFGRNFVAVGSVGFSCWLLSGYPLASLPLYYLGPSLAVAFHSVRCCHDDEVPGGVAHCYKPTTTEIEAVLEGARKSIMDSVAKVRKDPVKSLKKWFVFW